MKFSAVILAGGHSRRMGCDKAFLDWEGLPLLGHQIRTVQSLNPEEILISGLPDTDYTAFGCPVIYDSFSACGPLAGIEQALRSARAPLLLVLAVDMPAMTSDFLQNLAEHCTEGLGAVPDLEGGLQPTAAFYPKAAHPVALSLLQRGFNPVSHFAEQCVQAGLLHLFPVAEQDRISFANLNEPVDLIDLKLCESSCLPI